MGKKLEKKTGQTLKILGDSQKAWKRITKGGLYTKADTRQLDESAICGKTLPQLIVLQSVRNLTLPHLMYMSCSLYDNLYLYVCVSA